MWDLLVAFAVLFSLVYFFYVKPSIQYESSRIHRKGLDEGDRILQEAFEYAPSCKPAAADDATEDDAVRVLIMYASEYGFSRQVAKKAAAVLGRMNCDTGPDVSYDEEQGGAKVVARVVNVLHYEAVDFSKESLLLFICSTTGDGVPPTEAEEFRDALTDGLKLPGDLQYAVLALGDKTYPQFCGGGFTLEKLIRSSTAHDPVLPMGMVHLEDWDPIVEWVNKARNVAAKLTTIPAATADYLYSSIEEHWVRVKDRKVRHTRAQPFEADVLARIPLCKTPEGRRVDDPKNVIRVELDGDLDTLPYAAGDALGVLPLNNPEAVVGILKLLAANGDEEVRVNAEGAMALEDALTEHLDLRDVQPKLIEKLGAASKSDKEIALAERLLIKGNFTTRLSPEGHEYVRGRHVVDVLSDFSTVQPEPQTFVALLHALQTRYYSISSSPVATPARMAITLDVVRYTARGLRREGVCSTYLSDRIRLSDALRVFVARNPHFRLPLDGARPIVMIGPGTGIAPFMAFMAERVARGAAGRNVLFFGCRHADHDFLYRDHLEAWVRQGALTLHTAFSRDQKEKIYVQHRVREQADELWKLVTEHSAHIYVCGDGNEMAKDVHEALLDVVMQGMGDSRDAAVAFLKALQDDARYQRDVWVS